MKDLLFAEMDKRKIDWIILSGRRTFTTNLIYFLPCAFVVHPYLIIKKAHEPILIYENMEKTEALKSGYKCFSRDEIISRTELLAISEPTEKVTAFYEALFKKFQISGNVFFSGLEPVEESFVVKAFLQKNADFVNSVYSPSLFPVLRRTKSPSEAVFMRDSAQATVKMFENVYSYINRCHLSGNTILNENNIPVTLGDLRNVVLSTAAESGFLFEDPPIIAMGRDAASPHCRGRDSMEIKQGYPIVMDLSPKSSSHGYFSDMTRTFCIGKAAFELKEMYETVKTAYNSVLGSIKPGTALSLPDIHVSEYFKAQGHPVVMDKTGIASGYVHSLGHGIGLDVHEEPRISTYNRDENAVFMCGDVFTIEPGLYYEDRETGIRLEDSFMLNEKGELENLTEFPMELEIDIK